MNSMEIKSNKLESELKELKICFKYIVIHLKTILMDFIYLLILKDN